MLTNASTPTSRLWPARPVTSRPWRSRTRPKSSGIGQLLARICPKITYTYLKIKGSFIYENNVRPTYLWFNGDLSYRYLLGDQINPAAPTILDMPAGDINDPSAKIFPFKIHVAQQPYDTVYDYLLAPITAGDDGYWTNFDWDNAFRLAEQRMGLKYSGISSPVVGASADPGPTPGRKGESEFFS